MGGCRGRVGHGLRFHHGHGDRAGLLGAAAVRHRAVGGILVTRVSSGKKNKTTKGSHFIFACMLCLYALLLHVSKLQHAHFS